MNEKTGDQATKRTKARPREWDLGRKIGNRVRDKLY